MIELNARVLTIGTFDLFHVGHLRLLEAAAKLGNLTVGVNTDEFVEGYKGERPVIPHVQRAEIVKALGCVMQVNTNRDAGRTLIRAHRPTLLVVGSDWAGRDYLAQVNVTQADLAIQGTQLVYLPYTLETSSTQIRAEVRGRDRCRCMHPKSSHGANGCKGVSYQSTAGGATILCSCSETGA